MTQVKLFQTTKIDLLEAGINKFLQEHENSMELVDIKYTSEVYNPNDPIRGRAWSVMIMFNTK